MRNAVSDAWGFNADALEDCVARRCYFSGQSSTNTIQKTDPWSQQQPYLMQQFQQAANLYGNYTPSYYPGHQVAPLNATQQGALGGLTDVGMNGTPALNAAQGATANIAGGQMPGQQMAAGNFGAANSAMANNLGGAGIGGMMPAYGAMQGGLQNLASGGGNTAVAASQDALRQSLAGSGIGGMMPAYTQMQGGLANLAGGGGNAAVAPSQNALTQFLGPNSALTGSVAASVLPQIESQFGSAGGMSNPNAAYAASSGLTSAMAPYTLQAAQQQAQTAMGEQGIQLGASGLTNQAMLQQQALQQQAAQQQAQTAMGEQGIQLGASGLTNQAMLAQQALQQQAAQQASSNYFQGQGQQLVGSQIAPSLNASTLQNLQAALGAGGQSQQQQQANINAAMNAWNYNTMLPYNKLGMFGNSIAGNFGGTTNLQQPYFSNPIGQGLSGLAGAASIGNSLGLFGGGAAGIGGTAAALSSGLLGAGGAGSALGSISPMLGMLGFLA